jgi:hypothetical protein
MALLPGGTAAGVGIVSLFSLWLTWRTTNLEQLNNELQKSQLILQQQIQNQAQKDYADQRRVLLRSVVVGDSVQLTAINPEHAVNNITVFLPSPFKIRPFILTPPNFEIPVVTLEAMAQEYLDTKLSPIKNHVLVTNHYPLPALLVVHGYGSGRATVTTAVYDCFFEYIRPDSGASQIDLRAIAFNNYFPNEDPQNTIDKLFEKAEEIKEALNNNRK